MEGMRMGVKVEKPETYDGNKSRDLDTWLFQVREHLNLTVIPKRGHVPYAASLLHGNTALWWHARCVKGIVARLHGMSFAEFCTSSSGQKIMDAGDEMSSRACDNTGKKQWRTLSLVFMPHV